MDVLECQGCQDRDKVIAELRRQVQSLEDRLDQLEARLKQNSSNSSLPPSANPPGAQPPVVKRPTGRKAGGQPGHRGHARLRLPPDRVTRRVEYVPKVCRHCQAALPAAAGPNDPEPTWHQVAELPTILAEITEYLGHARTCPCCGRVTRQAIPDDVRHHAFGPRLTAVMSLLTGRYHLGKRAVVEVLDALFGVPLALGSVTQLEAEMSSALAPAHTEAVAAVRTANVKNVDETGWKRAGRTCWLWVAALQKLAAFVIHPRRGRSGLRALLGTKPRGWLCSDRWSAYGHWRRYRRQVCWAHLKRDFQKLVDRGRATQEIGEDGLELVDLVFDAWHAFRGGTRSRAWLHKEITWMRRALHEVLERGCAGTDTKAAKFCQNVMALEPALWTFVRVEGIEPTNNHAERVLRQAVLWRKRSFGCHSEAGCRFVERILTTVQTLHMQGRAVLDYLQAALIAHRSSRRIPKLIIES
jgi:transposase